MTLIDDDPGDVLEAGPHWTPRPITVLPREALTRGTFSLCHGCSNGRHTDHVPVRCDCDLCS